MMHDLHYDDKFAFVSAHWDYSREYASYFASRYERLENLIGYYDIETKAEALAFINDHNTNGKLFNLTNMRRGFVIISSKDLRVFNVYTKKQFIDGDVDEIINVGY